MNFKRYNESDNSWTDSHYIKKTAIDTVTTLPATIYPLAQTATLGLKGNTVQNGTPTPSAPVMPQGTGDKTANLSPEIRSANGWVRGYRLSINGSYISVNTIGEWLSPKIPVSVLAENKFNISAMQTTYPSMSVYFWNGDTYLSYQNGTDYNGTTFTIPENATHIDFAIRAGADKKTEDAIVSSGFWVMLNTGSTALPYEPYGYKIPISSAGQTTNVYLGEVQTTRKIRKLVLTGEENWGITSNNRVKLILNDVINRSVSLVCSHYKGVYSATYSGIGDGEAATIYENSNYILALYDSQHTSTASFKAYLQQQYAAGTPVCVWYVLATEETAVVNEPLMKIGSYADSISGISIPTTAGANTLDMQTTLKPSEVTASFNGWHPVSAAHEHSGGAWD